MTKGSNGFIKSWSFQIIKISNKIKILQKIAIDGYSKSTFIYTHSRGKQVVRVRCALIYEASSCASIYGAAVLLLSYLTHMHTPIRELASFRYPQALQDRAHLISAINMYDWPRSPVHIYIRTRVRAKRVEARGRCSYIYIRARRHACTWASAGALGIKWMRMDGIRRGARMDIPPRLDGAEDSIIWRNDRGCTIVARTGNGSFWNEARQSDWGIE